MIVDRSDKMPYEHDMIGTNGPPKKLHTGFVRCSVTLPVITLHTSRDKVFPGLGSPSGLWNDVVHSQSHFGFSAVLAAVTVTAQNILAGEDNFLIGDANVDRKADNAGKRHCHRDRAEEFAFTGSNQFCFS